MSRPLHVLLTTDVVGGVWDFSLALAKELTQGGHRVTLLAFGDPSPLQLREAATAGAVIHARPLKLEWMQDSANDVRSAVAWTAQIVQDLRPDVVHANQYAVGTLGGAVPVVVTAHSDVLSWMKWVRHGGVQHPMPVEWADYASIVRRGLRGAGVVTAVSRFMAEEARSLYGLDFLPRVIHNGWTSGSATPSGVQARRKVTLLAGRVWDAAKNLRLAEEAAHGWDTGRVLLAGERRHPESNVEAEVRPPLEPLGRVPRRRVERLLGQARVYISSALYDPFGLVPLQAALAGCPLLLSDIPSYRELWDGAALFFPRDDAGALRREWRRLLNDDVLAADLAARAWNRARTRFRAQRMAHDYLELYASLITRPTRADELGIAYA